VRAVKIVLVFLLFLLPQTVRSSTSEKANRNNVTTPYSSTDYKSVNEETQVVYAQAQYSPYTTDGTVIRQTQSVRVVPEITVSMSDFTSHVDSLFAHLYLTIETKEANTIVRKEQSMKKEAKAYLFIIPAITILSVIGIIVGVRTGDALIQKGSLVMLITSIIFTLFKVPVFLVLL